MDDSQEQSEVEAMRGVLGKYLELFGQYSDFIFGTEGRIDSGKFDDVQRQLQRMDPSVSKIVVEVLGSSVYSFGSFGRTLKLTTKHMMSAAVAGGNNAMRHNFRDFEAAVSSTLERTIGALDAGFRSPESSTPIPARTKVFIAHDGPSELRDKLEMECWRSGLEPLIVEEALSLDESVDAKVSRGLEGVAFAIVLARLDRGLDQDGIVIPRGNIIDEIGRIRTLLGDRYVILLEKGLALPTNLATGVVFEHFESDHFDAAILRVYKCLNANNLI